MHLLGSIPLGPVRRFGSLGLLIGAAAAVLVSVIRSRGGRPPMPRPLTAVAAALLWLRLAGEAALGDHRPALERRGKAVAAVLLGAAAVIHLTNRYRRRRHPAPPDTPATDRSSTTPIVDPPAHGVRVVPVVLPALGPDVAGGTVTRWLERAGDRIETGEPLVRISTDKVDTEMPTVASGTLLEIRAAEGETAPVGSTIAVIGSPATGTHRSATTDGRRSGPL